MAGKGLGLTDREYEDKNRTYGLGRRTGRDFERRNSEAKHGGYGSPAGSQPPTYRRDMQSWAGQVDGADQWSDAKVQEGGDRFLQGFEDDLNDEPGLHDGKTVDYTDYNEEIFNKKWDAWKAKAKQFGLSDSQAEELLQHWLAVHD